MISIGMTAYNAETTIEQALQSAAAQDWPDKEIIVVDDCSSDGTWATIMALQNVIPKMRVFRNEKNLGVAASRNRIIVEAQGEFIAFFDDDDISLPERLSRQYARIIAYERDFDVKDPVICHAARVQVYPDGMERYEPTMGTRLDQECPHGQAIARQILFNCFTGNDRGSMATCSQMARKSVYEALGGFDPDFRRGEDTEFNLRLALANGHFVGLAEPLVHQRMTLASDKKLPIERECTLMLYKKHEVFLRQHGSYEFNYAWVEAKYDFLEGYNFCFVLRFIRLFLLHPVLTVQRLGRALPNFHYNSLFRKFHGSKT